MVVEPSAVKRQALEEFPVGVGTGRYLGGRPSQGMCAKCMKEGSGGFFLPQAKRLKKKKEEKKEEVDASPALALAEEPEQDAAAPSPAPTRRSASLALIPLAFLGLALVASRWRHSR